jgi:hypothetical protein
MKILIMQHRATEVNDSMYCGSAVFGRNDLQILLGLPVCGL